MDIWLIIVTIVVTLLLIGVNFYLLVLYCHPDDKGFGASYFCKFVVIVGFTLSWAQVLMLPLDVGNVRSGGGLDMDTFWLVLYMIIAGMIVVLIPFSMFFYETDEEDTIMRRIMTAMCFEAIAIVVSLVIVLISWAFLKFADIPVTVYSKTTDDFMSSTLPLTSTNVKSPQTVKEATLEVEVSFPIYLLTVISFVGWFLFVLFGGLGLFALPIDLIMAYKNRPKILNSKDAAEKKVLLKKKVIELIDAGKKIKEKETEIDAAGGYFDKRKKKSALEKEYNKWKGDIMETEKHHEIFKLELNYAEVNPLVYLGKLILGILFVFVSLIWWIHIILSVLTRVNGIAVDSFLNKLLISIDDAGVGFLSTIIFGFFSLYILWAAMKGNFKLGMRIPFLFTFHPMKVNETYMNSFLFNVILILILSVPLTQFCLNCFSEYARFTSLEIIYGVQVRYMRFFRWFFDNNVFEYAIVIWSALTCFFMICRPADKPQVLKDLEKKYADNKV